MALAQPARRPQPAGTLGIVGLGLVGGSIAAAARTAWPNMRVLGVDRPELSAAVRIRDWIHEGRSREVDLADEADLIVLATPIAAIEASVVALGRAGTRAVVTDVGSTKRSVLRAAEGAGHLGFVGGHPLAGAETSGLAAARADLFDGRPWCIVPGPHANEEHVGLVEAFVTGVGALPVRTDAETHDRVMACVSHLPQLVAVALMNAAGRMAGEPGLAMSGRALAEMTRLASSPFGLWSGILESNADYVDEALEAFRAELDAVGAEETRGRQVGQAFDRAAAYRETLRKVTS